MELESRWSMNYSSYCSSVIGKKQRRKDNNNATNSKKKNVDVSESGFDLCKTTIHVLKGLLSINKDRYRSHASVK